MPKTTTLNLISALFSIGVLNACNIEKPQDNKDIGNSALYSEGHQDLFNIFTTKSDVIMLGDSLTDENEWHEFFTDITIINRGVRGESSQQVLDRIKPILKTDTTYTFVMIGINDIFRNYKQDTIVENTKEILNLLIQNNHKPILQSILYVSQDQTNINSRVTETNLALSVMASSLEVPFLDLNIVLAPKGYLDDDSSYDGIHLNGKAYQIWAKQISPIIDQL